MTGATHNPGPVMAWYPDHSHHHAPPPAPDIEPLDSNRRISVSRGSGLGLRDCGGIRAAPDGRGPRAECTIVNNALVLGDYPDRSARRYAAYAVRSWAEGSLAPDEEARRRRRRHGAAGPSRRSPGLRTLARRRRSHRSRARAHRSLYFSLRLLQSSPCSSTHLLGRSRNIPGWPASSPKTDDACLRCSGRTSTPTGGSTPT